MIPREEPHSFLKELKIMAQFFGCVKGSRGEATRLGDRSSGIVTSTKSWQGQVNVRMWHDARSGKDYVSVILEEHGGGRSVVLFNGRCDAWEEYHGAGSLSQLAWRAEKQPTLDPISGCVWAGDKAA